MEDRIKEFSISCGADVCGIANIDRFTDAPEGFSPLDVYTDCKSVVAIGISLPKGLTKVDSRYIYCHFNYFSCQQVDEISFKLAKMLEKDMNATAVPIPCDSPYEYWDEQNMTGKGLISMKHTAVLCGLGHLGKNTLLLNPKYGNLLTVGAVLTNLDLQSDPMSRSLCIDGCNKCIQACPVHAIKAGTVNQKLCRMNAYGTSLCGFDTVECNQCRVVCPASHQLHY